MRSHASTTLRAMVAAASASSRSWRRPARWDATKPGSAASSKAAAAPQRHSDRASWPRERTSAHSVDAAATAAPIGTTSHTADSALASSPPRRQARRKPSLVVSTTVVSNEKCTDGMPNSSGVRRRATAVLTANGRMREKSCVMARKPKPRASVRGAIARHALHTRTQIVSMIQSVTLGLGFKNRTAPRFPCRGWKNNSDDTETNPPWRLQSTSGVGCTTSCSTTCR